MVTLWHCFQVKIKFGKYVFEVKDANSNDSNSKNIHFLGELSVEDRIQVLDRFRDGLEKVLITTNVMARGIDIEQVHLDL